MKSIQQIADIAIGEFTRTVDSVIRRKRRLIMQQAGLLRKAGMSDKEIRKDLKAGLAKAISRRFK